jgi:hypothetical protein
MNFNDDSIHAWVNQKIPDKLWHYTSVQGFQGIIGSGSIYATDVRFLNDTEEFVHARKVAYELAKKAPEHVDINFPLRDTLKHAVDLIFGSGFLDPSSAQIFVAPFSKSEDDLSQWRGYSHASTGVSIGFDLRMFRLPVKSDVAVSFAPCVYDDDEKEALINEALEYFVKESRTKWADVGNKVLKYAASSGKKPGLDEIENITGPAFNAPEHIARIKSGLDEARKRIHVLSGLLKHRAFHHEKEWRLVLPISPAKDKSNLVHPIRYRSTGSMLIPYIAFPLGLLPLSTPPGTTPTPVLPVNDVILGPGTGKEAQRSALDFLKSNAINVVPRMSDVPYRQA